MYGLMAQGSSSLCHHDQGFWLCAASALADFRHPGFIPESGLVPHTVLRFNCVINKNSGSFCIGYPAKPIQEFFALQIVILNYNYLTGD